MVMICPATLALVNLVVWQLVIAEAIFVGKSELHVFEPVRTLHLLFYDQECRPDVTQKENHEDQTQHLNL